MKIIINHIGQDRYLKTGTISRYREKYIRTLSGVSAQRFSQKTGVKAPKKSILTVLNRIFGRSKKRSVRLAILGINVLIFSVVGILVASNSSSSQNPPLASLGISGNKADAEPSNPLDSLSSADIAVNVARVTHLPESTSVKNNADSQDATLAVTSSDDSVVSKPQIVSDGLKSNKDIIRYTAEKGDTVPSVATKFGITSETIRLSNNLDSDTLTPGMDLIISPIDGLVYRVQPSDTPESIAAKFHANVAQVIAFNDAELTGKFKSGELIVVPDGKQASEQHFDFSVATTAGTAAGPTFSFGGNGYDFGWCTYYAAARSGAPGNWGNAYTWDDLAPLSGWTVSHIPKVGAIAQTNNNHVGIVEAVRVANGQYQIKYSDMNGLAGFGHVGYSGWVSSTSPFQNYIYH